MPWHVTMHPLSSDPLVLTICVLIGEPEYRLVNPESMDPLIHGSMDPWIHGSMDQWIHGSMDQWIHGTMDPWISKYKNMAWCSFLKEL